MLILILLMILLVAPAYAEENCPVKLAESQTQSLLISQSRNDYEQRLAQAIRANQELGSLYEKASKDLKKAHEELAALKPKAEPKDEKK